MVFFDVVVDVVDGGDGGDGGDVNIVVVAVVVRGGSDAVSVVVVLLFL